MRSLLLEAPDPAPGRDGIGCQGHREEDDAASSTKGPCRPFEDDPCNSVENPLQAMGCAAQKVETASLPEMKQSLSASLAKGIAVRKASVPIVGEEEGPGRCGQG